MSQTESNRIRLEEIQAEIESAREQCSYPTFELFWLKKHGALDKTFIHANFLSEVANLESFNQVDYYRPLTPEGARKGVAPYIKRVIRKLVKFLLFPILQDQNRINANLMRTFQHVRIAVNAQLDENQRLQQENEILRERLEALEQWRLDAFGIPAGQASIEPEQPAGEEEDSCA